jgi:hypothetical protein
MNQKTFQSLKPIPHINIGDEYLLCENILDLHGRHASQRYTLVRNLGEEPNQIDGLTYSLQVLQSVTDNKSANAYRPNSIIERTRKYILKNGKLHNVAAPAEPVKIGLDEIYVGDEVDFGGKTYQVGGLSDCRSKVRVKSGNEENFIGIDEFMDKGILKSKR